MMKRMAGWTGLNRERCDNTRDKRLHVVVMEKCHQILCTLDTHEMIIIYIFSQNGIHRPVAPGVRNFKCS